MRTAFVASALLIIAPASALHAKYYDLDYNGVMLDGTSEGDLGAAGTNLAGDPFDLLFVLDYPAAGDSISESKRGFIRETDINGGGAFGSPPPVTAQFTVNGHTIDFSGTYSAWHFQRVNGGDEGEYHLDNIQDQVLDYDGPGDPPPGDYSFITASASGPRGTLIGKDPNDPRSLRSGPSSPPDNFGYFFLPDQTQGEFRTTSFTFSGPIMRGALPEPSSWVQMIMGFGLIGWVLRRHRAGHVGLLPT